MFIQSLPYRVPGPSFRLAQQGAHSQAMKRQNNPPQFGLCPICLSILAGGLLAGAGIAGLRSYCKKNDPYNLKKMYGTELGEALITKLQQIEKQKPGTLEAFGKNPEKASNQLMHDLGPELTQQLEQALKKKRKA